MGWERRHGGRWYLYWSRRENGVPVKEYLGCRDRYGLGAATAHALDEVRAQAGTIRRQVRAARAAYRGRVSGLVAVAEAANADLRVVADGLLSAAGFHKHHRGGWRMRRHIKALAEQLFRVKEALAEAKDRPLLDYQAPAGDAEAADVYARARAGDPAAQEVLDRAAPGDRSALPAVRKLFQDERHVAAFGAVASFARRALIRLAAGDDLAVYEAVDRKVEEVLAGLLADGGPDPSFAERLAATRAAHAWLAVHVLELKAALLPPAAALDKRVSQADRRLHAALKSLATLRRLRRPAPAAVTVVANQAVVNTGPTG